MGWLRRRVEQRLYAEMQIVARGSTREVVLGEGAVLDVTAGRRAPRARTAWLVVTQSGVALAFGGDMLGLVTGFRFDDVTGCGTDDGVFRVDWRTSPTATSTVLIEARRHSRLLADIYDRALATSPYLAGLRP